MEERNDILEELGVSIYKRDGKWYWMIKSRSFDSPEGALRDAISSFSKESGKGNLPKTTHRAITPSSACG